MEKAMKWYCLFISFCTDSKYRKQILPSFFKHSEPFPCLSNTTSHLINTWARPECFVAQTVGSLNLCLALLPHSHHPCTLMRISSSKERDWSVLKRHPLHSIGVCSTAPARVLSWGYAQMVKEVAICKAEQLHCSFDARWRLVWKEENNVTGRLFQSRVCGLFSTWSINFHGHCSFANFSNN